MKTFRTEQGHLVEDVKAYILAVLEKYPDCKIHVGTDSQRKKKRWINFATVIAFRYGTRGVHFIHSSKRERVFKSVEQRLMHEVELTVSLVLWLHEFAPEIKIEALEADVNIDIKWQSNKVYHAATGWLRGVAQEGTKVLAKPELLIAIRAANHLV